MHDTATTAGIRLAASCVCGSDLWLYRGITQVETPYPIGHEYCGVVEEVGADVRTVKPGQFVIGSFVASDNTCPNCQAGYQTTCLHRQPVRGAQAERLRVPLADGTLVATPGLPSGDLIPSLLTLSDVMGTGHHAALAARVGVGGTVAVIGDGAVGLCGVLAARRMGEVLKGQGKIILLRYAVGSESTEQREKGFTDTLAKDFPKISLLSDPEYAGPTSDSAQQKAQSLVTRYRGQVDAIFCANESSTFGMLRALDEAGMLVERP